MRGIGGLIALGVAALVIYLYVRQTGGAPAGIGGSVDPNAVGQKAKDGWDQFYAQPWFWTLAVSSACAVLGIMTWNKIGNWGRGVVLVAATVAAVIVVTR